MWEDLYHSLKELKLLSFFHNVSVTVCESTEILHVRFFKINHIMTLKCLEPKKAYFRQLRFLNGWF